VTTESTADLADNWMVLREEC